MNTFLPNIQGITVTVLITTESITEMLTMVTEITIDKITIITIDKITITMEYVCSNGEDPIMLNYELILKINLNLPQGGTTNGGTFNFSFNSSSDYCSDFKPCCFIEAPQQDQQYKYQELIVN